MSAKLSSAQAKVFALNFGVAFVAMCVGLAPWYLAGRELVVWLGVDMDTPVRDEPGARGLILLAGILGSVSAFIVVSVVLGYMAFHQLAAKYWRIQRGEIEAVYAVLARGNALERSSFNQAFYRWSLDLAYG